MDTRTATAELGWTANPASGVSVRASILQSCCVVLGLWDGWGSRVCLEQHFCGVEYRCEWLCPKPIHREAAPGLHGDTDHLWTKSLGSWPLRDWGRNCAGVGAVADNSWALR